MEEILRVDNLKKTFKLSRRQQMLEKTSSAIRVAVDGLSFSVNRGEIFGLLEIGRASCRERVSA